MLTVTGLNKIGFAAFFLFFLLTGQGMKAMVTIQGYQGSAYAYYMSQRKNWKWKLSKSQT